MDDFHWVLRTSFFESRLYDLAYFITCIVFVFLGNTLFKVRSLPAVLILAHCLLPLILYGGVISYQYMPDGLKYWDAFNGIRMGDISVNDAFMGGNVEQAALLFSIFPMPAAVTPASLAYINIIIYASLYYWLTSKKIFTPVSEWFYLIYPSFALYAGLPLRDTMIFAFMLVAIQWAREGRWFLLILPLFLLSSIKFQNAFILILFIFSGMSFGLFKKGISLPKGAFLVFFGFVFLYITEPVLGPEINRFRLAMYVENGGLSSEVGQIYGVKDFFYSALLGGFYFIVKPLPWEVSGVFPLIQVSENILVFIFLVLLVVVAWRRNPRKLMLWVFFIVFGSAIYGMVVFNYGTAARYRFPFILLFVIFVCADCGVQRVVRIKFFSRNAIHK